MAIEIVDFPIKIIYVGLMKRVLPSGELTFCNGKIHHFSWENPLFLWPFSIAMLVHQRVDDIAKNMICVSYVI